jgi:hypothetical protein
MRKFLKSRRPSPAMIVALLALFVAMGGSVYAANKFSGKLIKKGSEPGNRIKKDTITGKQVKESKLGKVPRAALADTATNAAHATDASTVNGVQIFPTKRVTADPDLASSQRIDLGSRGPFNFYARCFLLAGATQAVEYIEVTSGNAAFGTEGQDTAASLTSSTPEAQRELNYASAAANTINANGTDSDFRAASTDTAITGNVGLAMAKTGSPATGDGPFLSGNSCIFGGVIFG